MRFLSFFLSLLCFFIFPTVSYALDAKVAQGHWQGVQSLDLANRITTLAEAFLRTPYMTYPLGEGHDALYDKRPRLRFDGVDCQTFVETIYAMAFAVEWSYVPDILDRIRYRGIAHNGTTVDFIHRNHFISLQWIPSNTDKGFITPYTALIGKAETQYTTTTIDIASWYRHLGMERLFPQTSSSPSLLKQLHEEQQDIAEISVILPYLPLKAILNNAVWQDAIPHGSIILVVRRHWSIAKIIGTDLDVSHMGIAVQDLKGLYIIHAREGQNVQKVLLADYLALFTSSPSIVGISILAPSSAYYVLAPSLPVVVVP